MQEAKEEGTELTQHYPDALRCLEDLSKDGPVTKSGAGSTKCLQTLDKLARFKRGIF